MGIDVQTQSPPHAVASIPAQRGRILVVEDDGVARRFLELALARTGRYEIEVAEDVSGALETLSTSVVDLIISDVKLPRESGLQLLQRLRQEARFQSTPVIFVSSDGSLATKTSAFRLGARDYLTKPFDLMELIARLDGILARERAARDAWRGRRYNVAGDFTGIAFDDLVHLLSVSYRTGKLSILTRRGASVIHFEQGDVVHATFENLDGVEAFYQVMTEEEGQFEFVPSASLPASVPRTISDGSVGLLMEGARRVDEARALLASNPGAAPAAPAMATERSRSSIQTASELSPAFLGLVRESLDDPFLLGEPMLLSDGELEAWTEQPAPNGRLFGVIFGSKLHCVAAIAAMASPLGESQIVAAMRAQRTSLAIRFAIGDDRSIDLLLIDPDDPPRSGALRISPNFLLVAPSGGDWLELGVDSQVELESLGAETRPRALIGWGNVALEKEMNELKRRIGSDAPVLVLDGDVSEPGADLRERLMDCLGLLSSLGS